MLPVGSSAKKPDGPQTTSLPAKAAGIAGATVSVGVDTEDVAGETVAVVGVCRWVPAAVSPSEGRIASSATTSATTTAHTPRSRERLRCFGDGASGSGASVDPESTSSISTRTERPGAMDYSAASPGNVPRIGCGLVSGTVRVASSRSAPGVTTNSSSA